MKGSPENDQNAPPAPAYRGPWSSDLFDHRARIKACAVRVERAFAAFAVVGMIEALVYASSMFVQVPARLAPALSQLQAVLVTVVTIMAFVVSVLGVRLQRAISDHARYVTDNKGSKDHV